MLRRAARPLLDVAAAVLVSDPAASLAEVAEAAGIGRTTLHKHYATRDDLVRAVGSRRTYAAHAVLARSAYSREANPAACPALLMSYSCACCELYCCEDAPMPCRYVFSTRAGASRGASRPA